MAAPRGTFIVLEGVDGSGKGTQFKLLETRLLEAGYEVATFDFPRYDEPSSYFVRQYLGGAYGGVNAVGPYSSSLFYALDRFEAARSIREAIDAGKIVLCNRYTGSSMAHQGTKFRSPEERRGYFIWLDNLEFEMLRIPRPDISFVLRVPVEISLEFLKNSGKEKDIHENDPEHLAKALAVYDDMTQLFPKDFQRIDCVRGDKPMEIEAVQALLWQKISPLLPPPPQLEMPLPVANAKATTTTTVATTPAIAAEYYVPNELDDATAKQYRVGMDAILRMHHDMLLSLTQYLAAINPASNAAEQASAALQVVLPLAVRAAHDEALRTSIELVPIAPLTAIANKHLPGNHGNPVEHVQLVDTWPRNEFDLVPDMLYAVSDLSLTELRTQTGAWPYTRKLEIIESFLVQGHAEGALQKAHYSWDMLTDYLTLASLAPHATNQPVRQAFTPRYGYDVPALIEDADLTEQFEACFDASLELYSKLQQAGLEHLSQYAVLSGHRLRWKFHATAADMLSLKGAELNSIGAALADNLRTTLREVHPVIGEIVA